MGLPNFSVKRPIAISMVFLGMALMGWVSLVRLPVELMPNISFGNITIDIDIRGGIPPCEVEARIAKPIEEAMGTVSHLKNILSISKEGNCKVILDFEPGTDMNFAALEVREQFARIKHKLPEETERPVIAKYEYLDVPIMILAVTSDWRTPEELRRVVDDTIKERIVRVEGVAKVEVSGGRERKILVEIDQARLRAHSLSIATVINVLNLNNINLLAGDIKRARDKYLVRAMGEFQSLADIEEVAVSTTREGSIIRIKDIAEVKDSYLEPTGFARMNIQPAVSLYVQKESRANTVNVARGIQKELEKLRLSLDEDIEITPTFNQAEYVKKALDTVKTSLSYGAILAVLVLWFFLRNLRSTFIIALTIPISVLATFALMYLGKINLNVMTLSGLALGIGMLVDSSIVVLENILRKRKRLQGQSKRSDLGHQTSATGQRETAISGAREVALAIIASTITTVVVFLPLIFVNKEIQRLYSGLGLTVAFSLMASLFIALTLVPMLASRLKPKEITPQPKLANNDRPNHKQLFKASLFARLKEGYRRRLDFVIRYRYPFIACAFLIFASAIYFSTKLEKEFIGIAEQNRFTIFIQMPTGTRLDVSDRIVRQVEELVSKVPEVRSATARVEPWSSKVYVELVSITKRKRLAGEIIESIRPQTEKIQPAFIYFEEPEEVGTKEVLLEIYGFDYEVLKELAIAIASRMGTIEGLTDVKIRMREGRPELRLHIDKQRAALLGLSVKEIAEVVHAQMRGMVATRYHTPVEPFVRLKEPPERRSRGPLAGISSEEERKLIRKKMRDFFSRGRPTKGFHFESGEAKEIETIARLEEKYRRTFDDVYRLGLVTSKGEQVYLEQISDFNFDLGPSEIWRKNKSRMVQTSANTGKMALGTVVRLIRERLTDLKFPKDYFYRFGGNYEKMMINQRELTFAFWLTLILVFMVLASLFESYSQPFIVMASVPLAAIGVVAALTLTDKPVGIGVLVGAIMLAGIVVNNAIILIDRINYLRREGEAVRSGNGKTRYTMPARYAVLAASQDRLRPILMTTFTTVLGLLPMALDRSEAANLWSPLAITVIGGLISSTVLTLFIVPSVYLVFDDLKGRVNPVRMFRKVFNLFPSHSLRKSSTSPPR